jgi:hypothetical protein
MLVAIQEVPKKIIFNQNSSRNATELGVTICVPSCTFTGSHLLFSFCCSPDLVPLWCRELSFALSLPLLCLPHLLPSPAARAVSSSRGSPFKTLTKVQSMLAANLFAAQGALLHDNLVYIYIWMAC